MSQPELSAQAPSCGGTCRRADGRGPQLLTRASPRTPSRGGLTAHLLLSHSKACLATGRGQEDQLPLACPQPLGRHPTSPLPAVRGGLPCLAFTLGRSHTRGSCPGDTRQHLEQLRSVPVGSSSAHGGQAGEGGVQAAHWVKGPLAGRWGVGKRQGERQGQRETETGREREIDRD